MLVTLLVKFRNKDWKTTELGLLLQVLPVRIVTFLETLGSHLKIPSSKLISTVKFAKLLTRVLNRYIFCISGCTSVRTCLGNKSSNIIKMWVLVFFFVPVHSHYYKTTSDQGKRKTHLFALSMYRTHYMNN